MKVDGLGVENDTKKTKHINPSVPSAPSAPLRETLEMEVEILGAKARPEVVNRYLAEVAPPVHDPFAGGGSIPLEAQRLGLRAIASDLNPVAVLINKALIEIPPKFAGMPPVNPEARSKYLGARASSPPSKGWHSRGYLPHLDHP